MAVQLQRLYDLGARRVLVTGTGPLGCVPAELAQRSTTGECAVELMRAAGLFNPQLVEMVSGLNSELGADVFVAANTMQMHMDFISDPQAYGMSNCTYSQLTSHNLLLLLICGGVVRKQIHWNLGSV